MDQILFVKAWMVAPPVFLDQRVEGSDRGLRGQYDGIAGLDDLIQLFIKLPNSDKQFNMMPGISHASFQQKNYLMAYHLIDAFLTQPEPVYLA